MTGMVDADWATVRSTTGYCYWLADAVVAYLAKGQPTIALSSTESEIMAACLAALEAVITRGLLKDVGLPQLTATWRTQKMTELPALPLSGDALKVLECTVAVLSYTSLRGNHQQK